MEIEALSKQITTAIKTNGSVTLTGIGTISAVRKAARLSEDGTLIEPPAVVPVFDPDCGQGQESGEEYSDQIKRAIIERGRVMLPGIGEISLDENGVFRFNPAERCALNAEFFCLEPIALQPKVNFTEIPVKEAASESTAKKGTAETKGKAAVKESTPEAAGSNTDKEKTTKTKAIVVYTLTAIVILALLLYAFRDELSPLMERLLYSKEELELMKQLNL